MAVSPKGLGSKPIIYTLGRVLETRSRSTVFSFRRLFPRSRSRTCRASNVHFDCTKKGLRCSHVVLETRAQKRTKVATQRDRKRLAIAP
jgi:hypothetical protein